MEVILNDTPDGGKRLSITVPWDSVGERYRDIFRRYAALPVRGFRPGKTPAGAVEAKFGQYIINDLVSSVSRRISREAMQEQGLEAGSPIEISDAEFSKGGWLRFTASFIEMPQFELPDYPRLGLQSQQSEEQIDEISQRLLELTSIELPEALVENELKYSETPDPSPSERYSAAQRVKLMLILKKIAAKDGIEIEDRDVNERIERVAAENDVSVAELNGYLASGGGMSRLADSLLAESVFEYLIEIQQ